MSAPNTVAAVNVQTSAKPIVPDNQVQTTKQTRGTSLATTPMLGGQIVNVPLAPNAAITIPGAGTEFYFVFTSGPVNARPRGGEYGTADFVTYPQMGTGFRDEENQFTDVELQNPSTTGPIVVSLWVGFSSFIDNRLIEVTNQLAQAINPTYSQPATAPQTSVSIEDLSGTYFTDLAGNRWIAVSRQTINVSNLTSGTVYQIYGPGATSVTDPAVMMIPPGLPIAMPASGDYVLQAGGGDINALVSETYLALPAT